MRRKAYKSKSCKMLRGGSPTLRTIILKIEPAIWYFLGLAKVLMKFWIFVCLFYIVCLVDSIEIYVYITTKIAKRSAWTLQTVGFVQLPGRSPPVAIVSQRIQTDILQKKSALNSPVQHLQSRILQPIAQSSPICDVKVSLSPSKLEYEYQQPAAADSSPATKDGNHSPAILYLDVDNVFPSLGVDPKPPHSRSPACDLNLYSPTRDENKCLQANAEKLTTNERNYLKRKWNSWKLKQTKNKKKFDLSMQPVSSSETETPNRVLRWQTKAIMDESGFDDDDLRQLYQERNSPEAVPCCGSVLSRLKYKFYRARNCPSVSYRRF